MNAYTINCKIPNKNENYIVIAVDVVAAASAIYTLNNNSNIDIVKINKIIDPNVKYNSDGVIEYIDQELYIRDDKDCKVHDFLRHYFKNDVDELRLERTRSDYDQNDDDYNPVFESESESEPEPSSSSDSDSDAGSDSDSKNKNEDANNISEPDHDKLQVKIPHIKSTDVQTIPIIETNKIYKYYEVFNGFSEYSNKYISVAYATSFEDAKIIIQKYKYPYGKLSFSSQYRCVDYQITNPIIVSSINN